jgi:hypothetical protein
MRTLTSSLIPNQVPEFIRADYPTFVAFVEAYYEYLDQQGVDLKSVRDLDETLDNFIGHFRKELALHLPKEITVDEKFLLQHIKDQYLAKGSEGSFKLLFRLLYNKPVQVQYPNRQMLRASDGRWQQEISMFVKVSLGDPSLIDGKLVDVIKPNRVIKVLIDRRQYVEIEVRDVVQISTDVYEIFIDRKYFGDIEVGDQIRYKEIFAGTIVATTSNLEIVQKGTGFNEGQLFELKTGAGVRSIVKITRIDKTNGAILSAQFIKFGIGYGTDFTISISSARDYTSKLQEQLVNLTNIADVTIGSGAVTIKENTKGFAEQGYINIVDYTTATYWDGTYVGENIREFAAEGLGGLLIDIETPAILKIKLGALAKYPGYYSSNDGFISDAMFIQDSRYYQAFSYVLRIDERLDSYTSAVKTMVHPAGTALFGEFDINNEFDISVELESLVKTLGLSLKESVLISDGLVTFFMEKSLYDSPIITDAPTWIFIKSLADTATITDAAALTTGKSFTDSINTPTDSSAILFGKLLQDSPTILDDIINYQLGKTLTDSQSIVDSPAITTNKYLEDYSYASAYQEEGYVALNPYEEGNYFEVAPILYNIGVVEGFTENVTDYVVFNGLFSEYAANASNRATFSRTKQYNGFFPVTVNPLTWDNNSTSMLMGDAYGAWDFSYQ